MVPSLTKVEVFNFPLLHFPTWLCLVHGQLVMSLGRVKRFIYVNANVSVSSVLINGQFYLNYYFLHHRNSSSKRFSQMSIATSLFLMFIHQNTKSTTGLNIYNHLQERPKALLKMSLIDVNRLTLPGRPQNAIFEHIFQNVFLYCYFFNIDYRYVGKHAGRKIKNSFYICIKRFRDVQRTCKKCLYVTSILSSTVVPRTSIY